MKKIIVPLLVVLIAFTFAPAGCGEPAPGNGQRIVSLMPSNTEILFALGLGDSVVGVTDFCNYPPGMEEAVDAGRIQRVGDAFTVNEELIVSLEPALVILGYENEALIGRLNDLGIDTAVIAPGSVRETVESIHIMGELTGRTSEAELLAGEMEAAFKAVESKTAALAEDEKPRVLMLLDLEFLFVAGAGTLEDELITIAGGINAIDNVSGYDSVSEEVIIASKPDLIIGSFPYREQILAEKEAWRDLPAVQNEAVFDLDGDLVNRPTPRLVEGLAQLLELFHPEL